MINYASFWKPEATSFTVLPELSLLIGQKFMENAKNKTVAGSLKMTKKVNFASFWKPEATRLTMLPESALLVGQKLVENAKNQNGPKLAKLTIFGIFN